MSKKKVEPTDAMVGAVKLGHKLMRMDDRAILRAALNHPDAAELLASEWKANAEAAAERAERAEEKLADSVHVDEAATRVEVAREKGWDDAAQHIYNKGWEGVTALRLANPHRPAPTLPDEYDGTVLVPADGHESITTTDGQMFSRLTFTTKQSIWYGPNLAAQLGDWVIQTTSPSRLTPGTWKVEGQ